MKALSLSQPFAWSMFDPIADKGNENRSWAPPPAMVGAVIALHAAKSWIDRREYACAAEDPHLCPRHELYTPLDYFRHLGIANAPANRTAYTTSAILGVATIERVVTSAAELPVSQRRWFFGPFGWLLVNRRALPRPIPASGKQGLWTVPALVEVEIERQLGTVN